MSMIDKNTVSRIMEIADDLTPNEITYTLGNAKDKDEIVAMITLKIKLTIDEKAAFVTRVVNSVFDENGDYMPWYVEPIFMITLMQMTTNVPVFKRKVVDEVTGKKIDVLNVEKSYDLAKALNLRGVNNEIYQNLIAELQNLVADKIEYRKQMNIRKSENVLTHLQGALESVLNSIDQIIENENVKQLIDVLQNEKQNITKGTDVVQISEVNRNGDQKHSQ